MCGSLFILIFLEYIRLAKLGAFGRGLESFMRQFTDHRDSGSAIITHLYLLLGCMIPILVEFTSFPESTAYVFPAMSGVMVLGVMDSAASFFGTRFGRHKWPGTKKSIEGTCSAVLSSVLFALLVKHFFSSLDFHVMISFHV